jgi:hypothetical protein
MADVRTITISLTAGANVTNWITTSNGLLWRQNAAASAQVNTIFPATQIAWGNPGNTVVASPSVLATANGFFPDATAQYTVTVTYPDGGGPPGFAAPPPSAQAPGGGCNRSAWLALGTQTLLLEDASQGYFCTLLDLGSPVIREVKNDRPGQHGIDDRTFYYGDRVVSADVVALDGAGAQIDAIASLFAPYMNVQNRPVLHYVLDRPGTAERTITLRPSAFTAPIAGPFQRNIHLSWVAADPIIKDPVTQSVIAWSGSGVASGRQYALVFPRTYPAGSGGPGATTGNIHTMGDLPIRPLYRLYGPITNPRISCHNNDGSGDSSIRFDTGYQVAAGHFVDIDTGAKTAYTDGDPNQPAMTSIDWINSSWPVVNPYVPGTGANVGVVSLTGSSTSGITQVVVSWQDAYLT